MKPIRLFCSVVLFAATSSPARIQAGVQALAAGSGGTSTAGVPSTRDGTGSESSPGELEKQMCELINQDRVDPLNEPETKAQAQRLDWNDMLAEVARAHSRDMAARGFFDHVNPDGVSPDMRVTAAGIEWQAEGENIALYRSVAGAQRAFMDEARFAHNHRANILSSKYTEVGVGIVKGANGMYYITQEFVRPPKVSGSFKAGGQSASLDRADLPADASGR